MIRFAGDIILEKKKEGKERKKESIVSIKSIRALSHELRTIRPTLLSCFAFIEYSGQRVSRMIIKMSVPLISSHDNDRNVSRVVSLEERRKSNVRQFLIRSFDRNNWTLYICWNAKKMWRGYLFNQKSKSNF